MAKAAFGFQNLVKGLTPTGTSSSAAADLPWSNLNNVQPRYRARVAAASAILVWDLASAQSVDFAALISTSLPASATARLRASTADPTCVGSLLYDSGVQSTVTSPDHNGNVVNCFASVSARYWRWDLTGANPIDIGIAALGLFFRPGRNYQYGAQEGLIDLSIRDENPDTGSEHAIDGPKKRTKLITIQGLSKAETRDSFASVDRLIGASGDLLFVDDPDASWVDRARDSIWGGYRAVGADLATRVAAQIFSRSFRLTERL
jgi:hypothetical protein